MDSMKRLLSVLCAAVLSAGCASTYTTPGGPAALASKPVADGARAGGDMAGGISGSGVRAAPVPMANVPAMVAFARVQATGYRSRTVSGYGGNDSQFSVITTRDVESDETTDRIRRMPNVVGLAALNRLLLPSDALTEARLREAARRVNADVLVLYTFDTQFYVKDFARPVSIVTLGLSPNKRAYVNTTATALILDARSGYVYGGAETTDKSEQLSNGWTSEDAVDDTRRRTESRAFDKLVGELEKTWPTIVAQYGQPATAPGANATTAPVAGR